MNGYYHSLTISELTGLPLVNGIFQKKIVKQLPLVNKTLASPTQNIRPMQISFNKYI